MTLTPFLQFVAHPNIQQLLASLWYEGKYCKISKIAKEI